MPDNGSGVYTVPSGSAAVANTTIESSVYNALLTDLADALSSRINADGQKPFTGNQPMGSHKFTGLAAGSATGDSVRYEQVILSNTLTTRGDILAQGASAVARLALGTSGYALTSNGTDVVWATIGTSGIADAAVTLAKQANLAQSKLIGRATASTGVPEAVGLATGLAMSGGNLALQQATTSNIGGSTLAIASEVNTGTDAAKALTALALAGSSRTVKAWWDITSAGAINQSFGISSATKNSTGNYTVNLSVTAPHANYAASIESDDLITSSVSKTTTAYTYKTGFGASYNARDANSSGMIIY